MDATLSAYNPTWRDRLAQWMLGDGRPTAGQRDFVSGLLGSAGTGSTGMSVADFTPAGGLLGAQEAAQAGDAKGVALSMLPMPAKAAGGVRFLNKGAGTFSINAAGREIGRANLADDGLGDYLTSVRIDPEYQRQGLGSQLYDFIEREAGKKLRPSPVYQTDAARAFWEKRAQSAHLPGIIAYHGSPHSFDKFDLSKIGTGEGAQAYGHGLYFAEAEDVAKNYRDNLSRRNINATFDGRPVEKWPTVIDELNKDNWQLGKLLDEYGRVGGDYGDFVRRQRDWYRGQPEMEVALSEFEKRVSATHTPGSMYQVRINADPEHFLDWDKPLSEHPDEIRRKLGWTPEAESQYRAAQSADDDALLAALNDAGSYQSSRIPVPAGLPPLSATGEDIVRGRSVFDRASDVEKANRLRELGIPGLKYLDQGSRGAGEGSRNYVVFDDKLIDILRKYGLVGLLGGGAAMGGLQQSPNAPAL